MKSQIWLLDPRPNLPPSIVKAVEDGFELSEASHTPVMLEVRIRACHVHGRFIAKDNKKPSSPARGAGESACAIPNASCCRPPPICTRRKRSSSAGRRRQIHQGAQAQRVLRPREATSASSCKGGMYNS
jgi:indolepyruvate ferredoxin oxidoreductase alpha subunit